MFSQKTRFLGSRQRTKCIVELGNPSQSSDSTRMSRPLMTGLSGVMAATRFLEEASNVGWKTLSGGRKACRSMLGTRLWQPLTEAAHAVREAPIRFHQTATGQASAA